ncbi:MAG TPA: hypothetical protein VN602_13445 [Gemmatimonadaceae bacterium]|nr:hypothetical protein [Gemmatimonadaceae bacterium]
MRRVNRDDSSRLARLRPILLVATRTRRLVRRGGIVAILAGTALSGCAHQRSSAPARPPTAAPIPVGVVHPVPPVAPNHSPDSLFLALGTVRRDSTADLKLVRSIVKVSFRGGTAQRERQQAIDLIGGVVVGGLRITDLNGWYFVRIPGPTYGDIQEAVRKLRAMPQVETAFPLFADSQSLCCGDSGTARMIR